jgi:hypothetical protein
MLLHDSALSLKPYVRELAAASAAWCALTFLLYREALFTIIRLMSTDSISEWLGLLWLAASSFVLYLWWQYARRSAENAA